MRLLPSPDLPIHVADPIIFVRKYIVLIIYVKYSGKPDAVNDKLSVITNIDYGGTQLKSYVSCTRIVRILHTCMLTIYCSLD